jgi:hypothetical protein
MRPPAARAVWLAITAGSLTPQTTSPTNEKNLATPPQTHVRKKLEPKWAAVFNLNGLRVGELHSVSGPLRGV